jgi:hypothetical protein
MIKMRNKKVVKSVSKYADDVIVTRRTLNRNFIEFNYNKSNGVFNLIIDNKVMMIYYSTNQNIYYRYYNKFYKSKQTGLNALIKMYKSNYNRYCNNYKCFYKR